MHVRSVLALIMFVMLGVAAAFVWQRSPRPVTYTQPEGTDNYSTSMPVENVDPLVGLWHASPTVGAGWNARYLVYPNGTYVYHVNQMDCASRDRGHAGTWTASDAALTLRTEHRLTWEGGKEVPADEASSCATKTEIIGTIEMTRPITAPVEPQVLSLAACATMDEEARELGLECRMIGGATFYRVSLHPDVEAPAQPVSDSNRRMDYATQVKHALTQHDIEFDVKDETEDVVELKSGKAIAVAETLKPVLGPAYVRITLITLHAPDDRAVVEAELRTQQELIKQYSSSTKFTWLKGDETHVSFISYKTGDEAEAARIAGLVE